MNNESSARFENAEFLSENAMRDFCAPIFITLARFAREIHAWFACPVGTIDKINSRSTSRLDHKNVVNLFIISMLWCNLLLF
jgi:hypothetical protein